MSTIKESQSEIKNSKLELAKAEEIFHLRKNKLRSLEKELSNALRQGRSGFKKVQMLQGKLSVLAVEVKNDEREVKHKNAALNKLLRTFPHIDQPQKLIEELDDNLPFLLLPVRIETRFMITQGKNELWVRIFPDEIAANTHEKLLTEDEVKAGKNYWIEVQAAESEGGDVDENILKGAWRALAESFGGTRAAWIRNETKLDDITVDSIKEESWSMAPRSFIMPDRFVVSGFNGEHKIEAVIGNLIPSPLILGPDPQKAEEEFEQKDGELNVGEDIEWIYDFDKAVEVGMGVKIPLVEPFLSQGFTRLTVLGLRLQSDKDDNAILLDDLFTNHHYTPDGMSVLAQGTPTNNTDNNASGFSSRDIAAENSYSIEVSADLITPKDEPIQKSDGQRLVEALGISVEPFQHIKNSDQHDVADAMRVNKTLWHGTLGYYLDEMLERDEITVDLTREFFTDYITARGPIPSIRIGTQPYGVLLTSDFSAWKWSQKEEGDRFSYLNKLQEIAMLVEAKFKELLKQNKIAHVDAAGDAYENLLSVLGLSATSVEFYRRYGIGKETIWNMESFFGGTSGASLNAELKEEVEDILEELGVSFEEMPRLFELPFFKNQQKVNDPIVDDIPEDQDEKLSESKYLNKLYKVSLSSDSDNSQLHNYIGWLANSSYDEIQNQIFLNELGEELSVPRPLMYRMLRGALLQTNFDTIMQLYSRFELIPKEAKREVALTDVSGGERTVTRSDFMGADISRVMPELSQEKISVGAFLQTEAGISQPEALSLKEVRDCLTSLSELSIAELERVFVEHVDLCSYRLDAWQMGCFNRRLQQQRYPKNKNGSFEQRTKGIYLGAFGWVENLKPSELQPVDHISISTDLHDIKKDGQLFEQENNAGFIHGPSLNHAATAAVLRSAYMSHFDPDHPEKMAVNLSSERVRSSLDYLDGIRNGQELGAMLGYRFERGLKERHGGLSLSEYIPNIRTVYSMVADKITEDNGELVETKEAINVIDGYALLEKAYLKENPLPYPYDISGLPASTSDKGKAIISEVARMADDMDALKDLAISEGVFQVTQGNFDRAGASLKAFTEGNNPVEPEIARTPRGGSALTLRMSLHFDVAEQSEGLSPRAIAEPRLNKWLAGILPSMNNIIYNIQLGEQASTEHSLDVLNIQPIDLVYMIGDDLEGATTELENRIAHIHRGDDSIPIKIEFMNMLADSHKVTLFELLPLLRQLRNIITGCRPLAADDFRLSSEASDTSPQSNPKGFDVSALSERLNIIIQSFSDAVENLINSDINDFNQIRSALINLSSYGIADAFPHSAAGDSVEVGNSLKNQVDQIRTITEQKRISAEQLKALGDSESLSIEERVKKYRDAAKEIFGPAFNLVPTFMLNNVDEIQAATDFRDAESGLTRFHKENPYIVDEWLQGIARVHDKVGTIESVCILADAFDTFKHDLKPLQLPFKENDHWIAMSYPEENTNERDEFFPSGDYLSMVQLLTSGDFNPTSPQSGLMVDEWVEVIPNKFETTGIAVHYNQPSTEPPQAMLLAVTPEITGQWTWDKLMGVLDDTLDRAKLRAIEPEHIDKSAFSQLLPAVLSAVSSYSGATISTDYIHATSIADTKLARENG